MEEQKSLDWQHRIAKPTSSSQKALQGQSDVRRLSQIVSSQTLFYAETFFVTAIAANGMASSSVPASFQPPQLSAKPFDSGNESDGSDESDAVAIVGDIAFGDQIDDGVTG